MGLSCSVVRSEKPHHPRAATSLPPPKKQKKERLKPFRPKAQGDDQSPVNDPKAQGDDQSPVNDRKTPGYAASGARCPEAPNLTQKPQTLMASKKSAVAEPSWRSSSWNFGALHGLRAWLGGLWDWGRAESHSAIPTRRGMCLELDARRVKATKTGTNHKRPLS